jgi:hypothetical protein
MDRTTWTIATIALYVGVGLILAGIALAVLAALGFRHARGASSASTGVAS